MIPLFTYWPTQWVKQQILGRPSTKPEDKPGDKPKPVTPPLRFRQPGELPGPNPADLLWNPPAPTKEKPTSEKPKEEEKSPLDTLLDAINPFGGDSPSWTPPNPFEGITDAFNKAMQAAGDSFQKLLDSFSNLFHFPSGINDTLFYIALIVGGVGAIYLTAVVRSSLK